MPDVDAIIASHEAPNVKKSGLHLLSVPPEIARLEILALDVRGSTLAKTDLDSTPGPGQLPLAPEGGTWTLDQVPIGKDRIVAGHAYLPSDPDPRLSNLRVLQGEITGIEVRSGETVDAGILQLAFAPGVRYPPIDFTAPDPAVPTTSTVPDGNALLVSIQRPPQDDVAGYLIAVGEAQYAATPTIARSTQLALGDAIAPGIAVKQILTTPDPQPTIIGGLINGKTYVVLAYAFDSDLMGKPLNYARPGEAFGIPRDTNPPGPIRNLRITARSPTSFDISFIAPGEDQDLGLPAAYELHTASDLSSLDSADTFASLPPIMPPDIAAPGSTVLFTRTAGDLGVVPGAPFFLGMRAMDDSGNEGPIATVAFLASSTSTPQISALLPEIVLAGGELRIRGQRFGAATATVTLTYSTTVARSVHLAVERWSDSEVRVIVPASARSGTVALTRSDSATARAHLPVITRHDMVLAPELAPFEIVAVDSPAGIVAAIYREADTGSAFEGAIERIVDAKTFGPPLLPFDSAQRSTAIAGTFAARDSRFTFIASNAALSMTAAFVSSSTLSASEARLTPAVIAGGADRVSIAALDGGSPGAIRAMIAFSLGGVVRTATVADAQSAPFNRFTVLSATTGAQLDRVTIHRNPDSTILMAYRLTSTFGSQLIVRTNASGRPQDFVLVGATSRPSTGPGIEILSVPFPGSDQTVIAYDAIDAHQLSDVRLLKLSDYGNRAGYAPFAQDTASSRRLEDTGLIVRQGEPWIAILASVPGPQSTRLEYTEVRLSDLDGPDALRGEHPGLALDSAPNDARGRIGCKLSPLSGCPMVWLGSATSVLFERVER
jgi:hypothetical protein